MHWYVFNVRNKLVLKGSAARVAHHHRFLISMSKVHPPT